MHSLNRRRWRASVALPVPARLSAIVAFTMACVAARDLDGQQPMQMNMSESKPDMMMTGPLGISTDRQGSGTTWVPEAVLMPFRHALIGKWDIMSHWNVFLQLDRQSGDRGDTQFGSINWSMVMASRPLLGGRLQLRAMNSVEAATVGRCGYPLLLQSGETCHGAPNHDRQHPHDFFMEMAALYEHAISRSLAWSLYVAPSGEPATGPVAFMHRPSAMNDPMANITHHWQDASHITFGVATAALYSQRWKVEGSVFNGREPDENRWNFDLDGAQFSSYAGRLTVHPSNRWTMATSFAAIKGMEPDEPNEITRRATASALHSRPLGGHGQLATALVWGANRHEGGDWEPSALAEANLALDARNTLFSRLESVRKSNADLAIEPAPSAEEHRVSSFSLGYVREVGSASVLSFGIGARGTVNFVSSELERLYGSRTPTGLIVFLRVRPKPMTAEELAEMHERMRHAAMGMKMD